jgi:hypothetical protein
MSCVPLIGSQIQYKHFRIKTHKFKVVAAVDGGSGTVQPMVGVEGVDYQR